MVKSNYAILLCPFSPPSNEGIFKPVVASSMYSAAEGKSYIFLHLEVVVEAETSVVTLKSEVATRT